MANEADSELFSVREAARECGRNPETVRRWVWSGKLPAEKLGNQLFIKKTDLALFCRETAVRPYDAGTKSGLIERMRNLRNGIRTRSGNLDVGDTIEEMREERMNDIERTIHETAKGPETESSKRDDFLERAILFRKKLKARGYRPVDTAELVRKSREGRMRELRQSLR